MDVEAFDQRKAKLVQALIDKHIEQVERIEEHTVEQCTVGDHLLESYATGGRSGHCVSRCVICDYKAEGWD